MELGLQSLFGFMCTSAAKEYMYSLAETPQLRPSPRIRAHTRVRYWSAKIDDIS